MDAKKARDKVVRNKKSDFTLCECHIQLKLPTKKTTFPRQINKEIKQIKELAKKHAP